MLRRSSGASGAERGDSRCAPLMGLACGSRSLLSRRDRDYWFLAVGRLLSCCRVSLTSSAPSAARVSARLHPSSSRLLFRVPSLILPPLLSGALPDSGFQALFAAYRRRPLPREHPTLATFRPQVFREPPDGFLRFRCRRLVSSGCHVQGSFCSVWETISQPLDAIVALHQACHAGRNAPPGRISPPRSGRSGRRHSIWSSCPPRSSCVEPPAPTQGLRAEPWLAPLTEPGGSG